MSNTIGYFGVILPEAKEFTGAFLNEGVVEEKAIRKMLGMATQLGDYPAGNLSAVMVNGMVLGRPDIALTAAIAYSRWAENNWFYVIAYIDQGDGYHTEIRELKSRTVDEARAELEQVPEVMAIREHYANQHDTR